MPGFPVLQCLPEFAYFGSASSFLLELFLGSSPVVYWTSTDLGSSPFSVISLTSKVKLKVIFSQEAFPKLDGLPRNPSLTHFGAGGGAQRLSVQVLKELPTWVRVSAPPLAGCAALGK